METMAHIMRGDFIATFRFNKDVVFLSSRNVIKNEVNQKTVTIAPVVARLLIFFAKQPNKLVSRKEIMAAVWENYGFVVSTNSLNQTVCALRAAFEELGIEDISIKTIPRLGYCFYGDVSES